MGVLRLLYCDSAGVRRCRAVVYTGELPSPPCSNSAADDTTAAEHEPSELAAVAGPLGTTPSLLAAAAAGIISLPPTAPSELESQQLEQQGLPLGFGTLPPLLRLQQGRLQHSKPRWQQQQVAHSAARQLQGALLLGLQLLRSRYMDRCCRQQAAHGW
ncbi:hypothetical protein COO60DRAFT_573225 [Scenedesmus sp. NREL 46B-D3]|nr:hypothetical protein COO60DRAFT_573225 [Scenedesmus sp. NREL 46B-D3]